MQPARILAIGVLVPAAVLAQRPSVAPVLSGSIGPLHHQIDTRVPEAQRSFDEGLTMYYGFNREGARRSFAAAAALDPKAAMPHVGLALSFGPNLNTESTPADVTAGCTEGRLGATLARQADERAYAAAMATRNCGGLSFEASTAYAIAMGTLFQEHPDDPDAATLYADSLQMLRPRTGEQNAELVAVLELVLRRWPDHPGATHYYIHAVEGSASPERGLASARCLLRQKDTAEARRLLSPILLDESKQHGLPSGSGRVITLTNSHPCSPNSSSCACSSSGFHFTPSPPTM